MNLLSIFSLILLLAGAASAQDGAAPTMPKGGIDEVLRDEGPVVGVQYENKFRQRLANTIVFLISYKRLLDNFPVAAYLLPEIRKDCRKMPDPEREMPWEHVLGNLGKKIAIVRAVDEDGEKFVGRKLGLDDAGSYITLHGLCKWLDDVYLALKSFDVAERRCRKCNPAGSATEMVRDAWEEYFWEILIPDSLKPAPLADFPQGEGEEMYEYGSGFLTLPRLLPPIIHRVGSRLKWVRWWAYNFCGGTDQKPGGRVTLDDSLSARDSEDFPSVPPLKFV